MSGRALALALDGTGERLLWPIAPGSYTEDDFCVDPGLGLAIVARGSGAIGGQGKPASKLAVWSVTGEVAAGGGPSAEERLRAGLGRAKEAVARLSASWPEGLGKPSATLAAVLADGGSLLVAHLGDCRVSLLGETDLRALTRDHTLGNEHPSESGSVSARALREIAWIPTRTLGGPGEPEIQRVPARLGDVLLLATPDVHRLLTGAEIAAALRPFVASGDLAGAVRRAGRLVEERSPDFGRPTLAVVRVTVTPGVVVTRASREPPRLDWLYAPGAPLADPPPPWDAASRSRGPSPEWFAEVFQGVMGAPR